MKRRRTVPEIIPTNKEWHRSTEEHPTESVGDGPRPVSALQLRHHGDQGHVEEDPDRAGEEPGGKVPLSAQDEADQEAEEGEYWGDKIIEDSNLDGHPGVKEQSEVPDLVRQLVTEDGDAGGEAGCEADGESSTNSDTVSEVVDGVPQDDHHAGGRHPADRLRLRPETLIALFSVVEAVETGHALALQHNTLTPLLLPSRPHLTHWRGLPGRPGADREVLRLRPAVGVGVAEALKDPVHHEEGNDGEAGREPFPDDAGGAVSGLKSVREQVHQGVSDQGPHGQRDEQLEKGVLVATFQHRDDADCDQPHQRDDGDGGEAGQPGGGGDGAQPGHQGFLLPDVVMVMTLTAVCWLLVVVVVVGGAAFTGQSAGGECEPDQAGQEYLCWPHGGGGGGGEDLPSLTVSSSLAAGVCPLLMVTPTCTASHWR